MRREHILLEIKNLKKYFAVTKGVIRHRKVGEIKAVDSTSFYVRSNETLGLVGESGCGKTTLGRCILQLYRPTSGQVIFQGKDITRIKGNELRQIRQSMQIIFQDPYGSLNPRHSCRRIIGEPLKIHRKLISGEIDAMVNDLMGLVGLNISMANRFPHEFSGGQRQRIGIARALALRPKFIVCDEPVSALDVSIQAQVINLLEDLQHRFKLTYLFVAHDLSVVRHISSRIAVMYLGKIVEITSREGIYQNPLHPYTKALLSAVPIPDPDVERQRSRIILKGDVPSALNPPSGCNFHPRCPNAIDRCSRVAPELVDVGKGGGEHLVACWKVPDN